MKGIADLHIHSRYSRATSKQGTPEYLELWAKKKGISIVGTGDFTHPEWRKELAEKLVPAEDGFYCLRKDSVLEESGKYGGETPRFVISGEISSIYKKNGKVRKVHNVILLPGLEDAEKLSKKLETIGNIHSDGRPILGLDSHDLLEIMLEICPEGILIPAHIWTPHFSLFGAFSGFDTMEECFEDLTPYIHAVETGLSSDPPMNWRLSALDRLQLISNSDAHSPAKLGREANLLDIEMSYQGLYKAIQEGKGLEGTIEFFPEEGKYHFDGHRKCHLCLTPKEAEAYGGICPVCGKKITIGVDHRVMQLSDRDDGEARKNKKPYENLVPLPEVIAASTGKSSGSKKVQEQYENMLKKFGPEFDILRKIPIEEIRKEEGYLVSEGIRRLRAGQVKRKPGFDGEYGTISLFEPEEIENPTGQMSFFNEWEGTAEAGVQAVSGISGKFPQKEQEEISELSVEDRQDISAEKQKEKGQQLNEKQKQAVEIISRRIAVAAGPGTGKTKTLISRILYLLEERKVSPAEITAVTFTNQAAKELKERLEKQLGSRRSVNRMHIGTFHSLCLDFLKKQGKEFFLADPSALSETAREICKEYGLSMTPSQFLNKVSVQKTGAFFNEDSQLREEIMEAYHKKLREENCCDFDDLLLETLKEFREIHRPGNRKKQPCERCFSYLMVDEFQDINTVQYELIQEWNKKGKELFVIGDPDQSIYGFRGSDSGCFLRMKEEFPETCMISLENNYRSTGNILNGALAVIRNNPGMERCLKPWKEAGLPVQIAEAPSKRSEAIFVAKEVSRLVGGMDMLEAHEHFSKEGVTGKRSFRDIAVLYRTHHQARILEKCFQQEGIPYVVSGSIYEELKEKYQDRWKKEKPKKLMHDWIKDLDQENNGKFQSLADMAVFYSDTREFLDALLLGEEGVSEALRRKKCFRRCSISDDFTRI